MATETELLADVLAAPDDDAPRLAYAAECDRTGDARGELIRVQLDLAHSGADRSELNDALLRARASDLIEAHGAAWGASVQAFVDAFEFDRGFVEWVKMSASDFLVHAPRLFQLAPVRHLDLVGAREVLDELLRSTHLVTIRSLALERSGLDDADLRKLGDSDRLAELRWLSVAKNEIGVDGAAALASSPFFPKLAYARFTGNPVDPNERYSQDGGRVIDAWLPEDGQALEARFGYIPWLHGSPTTDREIVPDRFRIAPATT